MMSCLFNKTIIPFALVASKLANPSSFINTNVGAITRPYCMQGCEILSNKVTK